MIKLFKVYATVQHEDWNGEVYNRPIECDCWANDAAEARKLVLDYRFDDYKGMDFVGVTVDTVVFVSDSIEDNEPPAMTKWEYTV